ncbi:MAG: hypothetical protein LBU42_07580 [Prevotellaceae bacterium]|jgi:hypothetical protein|nr:hypothetical protein [Prevotellaceae bacterium]
MKKIFLLTMVALIFTCNAEAQEKSYSELGVLSDAFLGSPILAGVKKMTDFQIIADSGKTFIQGSGVTAEGNSVLFRKEMIMTVDSKGLILIQLMAATESCTGVNCAKCSFKTGGGCNCDNPGSIMGGASYCNHSIVRDTNPRNDLVY